MRSPSRVDPYQRAGEPWFARWCGLVVCIFFGLIAVAYALGLVTRALWMFR